MSCPATSASRKTGTRTVYLGSALSGSLGAVAIVRRGRTIVHSARHRRQMMQMNGTVSNGSRVGPIPPDAAAKAQISVATTARNTH